MDLKYKVKKGLRLIFVDLFALVVGILNGFFLPMVFSIEGYALFRTFTLYATYAVVFSFGLSDGLYLLYGGKDERDIDAAKTKAYYFFLIKLQVVVFIVLFLLSYFLLKDTAFIFFCFFVAPLQLIHFFRLYYKALGEFDKYSLLQVVLVIFELVNTLLIVFYIKSEKPDLFITIKILNHLLIAVLLTFLFYKKFRGIKTARLNFKHYLEIIKPGILVLIADMAAVLLLSMDRWFVIFHFSKEEFAYYAFAVSILSLFIVLISSVTSIFYSYISRKVNDDAYIRNLKNYVLLVSSCFPLGYFIIRFVLKTCLIKYIDSLEVFWILVMTLPFTGIVNIVYINMYKASGNIKPYLKRIMAVLIVSFVLNVLAVSVFNTIQAVAWASLISFVFWYIYSSRDFQAAGISGREIMYLLILVIVFVLLKAADINLFLSLCIYTFMLIADVSIFYRREVKKLFSLYGNG